MRRFLSAAPPPPQSRLTREEKALVKLEEVNPQAAITKRREQMERDRCVDGPWDMEGCGVRS